MRGLGNAHLAVGLWHRHGSDEVTPTPLNHWEIDTQFSAAMAGNVQLLSDKHGDLWGYDPEQGDEPTQLATQMTAEWYVETLESHGGYAQLWRKFRADGPQQTYPHAIFRDGKILELQLRKNSQHGAYPSSLPFAEPSLQPLGLDGGYVFAVEEKPGGAGELLRWTSEKLTE